MTIPKLAMQIQQAVKNALTAHGNWVRARLSDHESAVTRRMEALEGRVGVLDGRKAIDTTTEHQIGDIVQQFGKSYRCVGHRRWRLIEDEGRLQ